MEKRPKGIAPTLLDLHEEATRLLEDGKPVDAITVLRKMERLARMRNDPLGIVMGLESRAAFLSLDMGKHAEAYPLVLEALCILSHPSEATTVPDITSILRLLRLLKSIEDSLSLDEKVEALLRTHRNNLATGPKSFTIHMLPPSERVQRATARAVIHFTEGKPGLAAESLAEDYEKTAQMSYPEGFSDVFYLANVIIRLGLVPFVMHNEDILNRIRIVRTHSLSFNQPKWMEELLSLVLKADPVHKAESYDPKKEQEAKELTEVFRLHVEMGNLDNAYQTLLRIMSSGLSHYVKDNSVRSEMAEINDYNKRWLLQAFSLLKEGKYKDALCSASESLRGYRKVGNRIGEIDALHMHGRIEHESGDQDKAVSVYNKVLMLSEELGYQEGIARVAHCQWHNKSGSHALLVKLGGKSLQQGQ